MIADPGFDVRQPSFYCDETFWAPFLSGNVTFEAQTSHSPKLENTLPCPRSLMGEGVGFRV